jgi:predicted CXXCH cytochrome family protein
MLQKGTTVLRRSPIFRKFLQTAIWLLTLLAAVATAAVWETETLPEPPEPPETPEIIEEVCQQYQDKDALDLDKKFVHPALDEGCAVCHIDCSQIPPEADAESIPEHFLKVKQPDLCLECHVELHPDLEEAHDDQPLDKSRCSGCHDAHASNIPKRLYEISHGPYAARLCSDCHADPLDGTVRLEALTVNALCYECHSDFSMRIDSAKSSHKLLAESDRSCMDCHDPHAARQEFVLTQPVYELCIGCHEGKPQEASASEPPESPPQESVPVMPSLEEGMRPKGIQDLSADNGQQYIDLSREYVHEPVRKSCTLCHDAHASEFTAELRAPVYDLCMECHGENAEEILNSSEPFPFLNGLVSLPPKSYEELPYLDLNSEFIHEPVSTSCIFCHDAHASDNREKLYVPVHELCIGCHNDTNARRILGSTQPFPLYGGKVILPPNVFEKLSGLRLVKQGSIGHPLHNHPVYIPATEKDPEFNCLTCHTSHAASTGLIRLESSRGKLCLKCHRM